MHGHREDIPRQDISTFPNNLCFSIVYYLSQSLIDSPFVLFLSFNQMTPCVQHSKDLHYTAFGKDR